MKLSRKYANIEAQINSELKRLKPDFELLFYLRSLQSQMLRDSFDLLKKERFGVSAINKRMRAIRRKYSRQT